MHVIADLTVVPLGVGLSLSPYVALVERLLDEAGLSHQLHPNGTSVEGEWDAVMAAVKRCHEMLHGQGVPRVHTDLKLGTRTDKPQGMADKIASVRAKLG